MFIKNAPKEKCLQLCQNLIIRKLLFWKLTFTKMKTCLALMQELFELLVFSFQKYQSELLQQENGPDASGAEKDLKIRFKKNRIRNKFRLKYVIL
jgi:hypothetical protein